MTLAEAAKILGCSVTMVRRHVASGLLPTSDRYRHRQLSRGDVEALALQIYRWRHHLYDVDPYWVTGQRAANILRVDVSRLRVLAARGSVPSVTLSSGTRLFRSQQLEVVAHARQARRH